MNYHTVKPPCYGCDKRNLGCHSTCEAYKDYRAIIESERIEHQRAKDNECILVGFNLKSVERVQRARGLK